MKSLAFFALSAIASATTFAQVVPNSAPSINISGQLTQITTVNSYSSVDNKANAYSSAIQNLSSNRGKVNVAGWGVNTQTTTVQGSAQVSNESKKAGDLAVQNIASNYGNVGIYGHSDQNANINGGSVRNTAEGGGSFNCYGVDCDDKARAIQNLASNAGDITVDGKSNQVVDLNNTTTSNSAKGKGSIAVQNLASNYGDVNIHANGNVDQLVYGNWGQITNDANGDHAAAYQNLSTNYGNVAISGALKQYTYVLGTVANHASGAYSTAVQNLSSNEACPPPVLPGCPNGQCWTTAQGL